MTFLSDVWCKIQERSHVVCSVFVKEDGSFAIALCLLVVSRWFLAVPELFKAFKNILKTSPRPLAPSAVADFMALEPLALAIS